MITTLWETNDGILTQETDGNFLLQCYGEDVYKIFSPEQFRNSGFRETVKDILESALSLKASDAAFDAWAARVSA